jgi:hypothetical protein
MTLAKLKELILAGKVMLPSVQCAFMAIEHLRQHGHAVDGW